MKIAIYIDIDYDYYLKHHIKYKLVNEIKSILTATKSKASLIEHPIVYKDEDSIELKIK